MKQTTWSRAFCFTARMFYDGVINPRGGRVSVYSPCQGHRVCWEGGVLQDISTGWTAGTFSCMGLCLQDGFCHHLAAILFFLRTDNVLIYSSAHESSGFPFPIETKRFPTWITPSTCAGEFRPSSSESFCFFGSAAQ